MIIVVLPKVQLCLYTFTYDCKLCMDVKTKRTLTIDGKVATHAHQLLRGEPACLLQSRDFTATALGPTANRPFIAGQPI